MNHIFPRSISACLLIILWYLHEGEPIQYLYGGILQQETFVRPTDTHLSRLIKFAQTYAWKRFPWAIPVKKVANVPEVTNVSKSNLVYTHDNTIPLYAEDEVQDKHGHRHKITSFIIFGTIYKCLLTWKHSRLHYIHNFTILEYPNNVYDIYAHTFYIENLNTTYERPDRYLFSRKQKLRILSTVSNKVSFVDEINSVNDVILDKDNHHEAEIFKGDLDQSDLDSGHVTSSSDQSDTRHCEAGDLNCGGDGVGETAERVKYVQPGRGAFKVMSYNIWNMNSNSSSYGGYTHRMEHLIQTIVSSDADIVGLQEVRYEEQKGESLGPSQIHTLSEGLPQYQFVYQPAQMQPNSLYEGRTEEGVAILSKFPILSHDYVLLFINTSNSADTHQRILLHARVLVPLLGEIHIITTHLSLSHEAREESVIQIWQHMKSQQGAVIFLGDLNAEPSEHAIQFLSGKDVLETKERSKLIDVWRETHGDENPGYTFNTLEKRLSKRIDYMYLKVGDYCCRVDSCDVLDDNTRGRHAASDHLPLMATFSFDENSHYR